MKNPANPTKPTQPKRGQRRRRVVPLWRGRRTLAAAAVLIASLGAYGGWWLWHDGWVGRAADQVKWKLIAVSGDLGFTVQEVLVVGRRQTARSELLAAARLARGAPILAFDLEAAKRRIEALPWIRSAAVERMLPDTVLLRLDERRPLALWQNRGRFALIDRDGEVILEDGLEPFADLLLVVGEDAPAHAAELLRVLESQPRLMRRVKAAVRVGGRRWNIRLKNGIDVRLPEEDPASAWERLAEYDRTHRVLARDIEVLDLRLPDRLIVRQAPRPAGSAPAAGQET